MPPCWRHMFRYWQSMHALHSGSRCQVGCRCSESLVECPDIASKAIPEMFWICPDFPDRAIMLDRLGQSIHVDGRHAHVHACQSSKSSSQYSRCFRCLPELSTVTPCPWNAARLARQRQADKQLGGRPPAPSPAWKAPGQLGGGPPGKAGHRDAQGGGRGGLQPGGVLRGSLVDEVLVGLPHGRARRALYGALPHGAAREGDAQEGAHLQASQPSL